MKILHLFSDWKWTGPAEPVLTLCQELERRGHDVILAYRKAPAGQGRSLGAFVRERGIHGTEQFHLNRYFSLTDNPADVLALRRFIRRQGIQVVHTHLTHDHLLGGVAARLAGGGVAVVRSDHRRDSFAPTLATCFLLRSLTDGVITFSARAQRFIEDTFGLPPERVAHVQPAVNCERFHPALGSRPLRTELGIGDDEVVVGVVARFQRYRKIDLFLDAFARAVSQAPWLKAMLVGRSSQMRHTVHEPVRALGLQPHVLTPGYFTDRYPDALASMDLFVFLMAGSDGTGRALREAMAMARPVLVNSVGMLPEMVEDGVSGIVFQDSAEDLAAKLVALAHDPQRRDALGRAARRKAERDFSPEQQAWDVESFYRRLVSLAPRPTATARSKHRS